MISALWKWAWRDQDTDVTWITAKGQVGCCRARRRESISGAELCTMRVCVGCPCRSSSRSRRSRRMRAGAWAAARGRLEVRRDTHGRLYIHTGLSLMSWLACRRIGQGVRRSRAVPPRRSRARSKGGEGRGGVWVGGERRTWARGQVGVGTNRYYKFIPAGIVVCNGRGRTWASKRPRTDVSDPWRGVVKQHAMPASKEREEVCACVCDQSSDECEGCDSSEVHHGRP